jgi:septum formation protein
MQKTERMLQDALADHRIILASSSPRRKELLEQMGLKFEQRSLDISEDFPPHLQAAAIPDYLAIQKADAYKDRLKTNEILITADTIVWYEDHLLAKPQDEQEARMMLSALSDDWHEVITSVCCTSREQQRLVHETTLVRFRKLREEEITYYVAQFQPLDKAGAYGIQEWLGLVGIAEISGSYTNVVGLPTASLYELLRAMV